MAASTIGPGYSSLTPRQRAQVAYMRFGLGPKPGGPAALSQTPNAAYAALTAELSGYDPIIPESSLIYPGNQQAYQGATLSYATCCMIGRNEAGSCNNAVNTREQTARLAKHLEPNVGFVEQLVVFWSNHFSICLKKGAMVRATVGQMERSAIRQNVLGKFSDMLKAVVTHPAMIFYLDNQNSAGPASPSVVQRKLPPGTITYNENLAREILELHTVGFDGGYTQSDVTTLAKVITGWTVYPRSTDVADKPGQFYFEPTRHQPGSATIMGTSFPQPDQTQGLAVLDFLARRPQTARHIARKLLQHFVCDEPEAADIQKLADVFIATDGNLRAVASALLNLDVAWSTPLTRLRQPYPWMVSMLRGLGMTGAQLPKVVNTIQNLLALMNQGMWSRITPDGYADDNYVWLTPNTVRLRKDVAGAVVNNVYKSSYPGSVETLAHDLLSQAVPAGLGTAISTFKDPRQSLAMLFVTPEFMRR